MLQSMRSKIKGTVAFVLIGLLTIPLALVGIENIFYDNGAVNEVASVDSATITEREVQLGIGRERQRLQAQFGDSLPANFLSNERLRGSVIDSLIQRALVANVAADGKMNPSEQQIDRLILDVPDFQVDGKFNQPLFLQVVRSLGHTPASFKQLMREDLAVNQLQTALISTDFVTEVDLLRSVSLSRQARDFAWVTLPLGDLTNSVVTTEEEVQARYDSNKAQYLTQQKVAVEYIEIDASDLEKDVSIEEKSIRDQYEQELASIATSIEREAAHIMIQADDEQAEQKIAELEAKLAEGVEFAALAKEYSDDFGTKDTGGNLGLISSDSPAEFITALETLAVGEVAPKVELNGAWHFLKLLALDKNEPPTFEQERTRIESNLKTVAAEEQFVQNVELLKELSYNAETLEEVAQELNVALGTTELFTRNSVQSQAVLKNPSVIEAAFSPRVLEEGYSSDVIELSPTKVVVVKRTAQEAVRTLTIEEKRDEITAELKLEKAKAEIAAQASSIEEALTNGESIEEVAHSKELSVSSQKNAQRNVANVPSELVGKIFEMQIPSEGENTIAGYHLENGDYAVVSLSQVKNGSISELTDNERNSLRNSLANSLARDGYTAWQSTLRDAANVDILQAQAPQPY